MIRPSGSPCNVYRNNKIEILRQSDRKRRYAAEHPEMESSVWSWLSVLLRSLLESITNADGGKGPLRSVLSVLSKTNI